MQGDSTLLHHTLAGGGEGFSGGRPGETWKGCYRVDYSDAGYAIVIVEDATWHVDVSGQPIDLVPAGEVGAGLIQGVLRSAPSGRPHR